MDEREKIERLAKAMGHDVWRDDQGFTVICGLHSDWNPWQNPADLRPVLEFFEQGKATLTQGYTFGRSIYMEFGGDFMSGVSGAIQSPNIIADAALAVLDGDPCTK